MLTAKGSRDLSYLGDAFYRLEVHITDRGVAVEEFRGAPEALAALDRLIVRTPRTVSDDGSRVIIEGMSAGGAKLRAVLSHYTRTDSATALRAQVEELMGQASS